MKQLIHTDRLDDIPRIDIRLRLMVACLRLYRDGMIDRPLPHQRFVALLRDATPDQRPRIVKAFLELQNRNPDFAFRIPTEMLVLAIYETDEFDQLIMQIPWCESVRQAIEDVTSVELERGRRRTMPIELRVPRTFGGEEDEQPAAPLEFNPEGLLELQGNAVALGRALKSFRWLWRMGFIEEPLPAELVLRALASLDDPRARMEAASWGHRSGLLPCGQVDGFLLRAIDELPDPAERLQAQLWYLEMHDQGLVQEPLGTDGLADSLRGALELSEPSQMREIADLLPKKLRGALGDEGAAA